MAITIVSGDFTICDVPLIDLEEKTVNFATIESARITADIHEAMWGMGYTFVGPVTQVADNLYHSTFRRTH